MPILKLGFGALPAGSDPSLEALSTRTRVWRSPKEVLRHFEANADPGREHLVVVGGPASLLADPVTVAPSLGSGM